MFASLNNFRARRIAPVTRLAEPNAPSVSVWPTVSIVFLLCVAVVFAPLVLTVLNSTLVMLTAALVLFGNRKIPKPVFHIAVPFGLIAFLGLATGAGADRYTYFKDLWYVLNPLVVVLTGYILYLAKPDLARGLRAFVIAGVIVGLWQMRGYAIDPSIIFLPGATIRAYIGTGFYAPVLSLIILVIFVGRWKQDLKLPSGLALVFFVVLSLAVAGVFSRAAVMVLMIGAAAALGCFAKREWLRAGLPVAALLVLVYILQIVVDTDSDRALLSFGSKLIRSVTEITASDYTAARDVAVNFRGYETQRALDQFASSDVVAILFGQGFGALVDLGFNLPLGLSETGGRYTRYIEVLHNGYMYLLTKVGLLGLLLFIYVLAYLYFTGRKWSAAGADDQHKRRTGRLLQATGLSLAASTYIIAGVFNKTDMMPFLLMSGYLLAHIESVNAAPDRPTEGIPAPAAMAPSSLISRAQP